MFLNTLAGKIVFSVFVLSSVGVGTYAFTKIDKSIEDEMTPFQALLQQVQDEGYFAVKSTGKNQWTLILLKTTVAKLKKQVSEVAGARALYGGIGMMNGSDVEETRSACNRYPDSGLMCSLYRWMLIQERAGQEKFIQSVQLEDYWIYFDMWHPEGDEPDIIWDHCYKNVADRKIKCPRIEAKVVEMLNIFRGTRFEENTRDEAEFVRYMVKNLMESTS